jgi:hypothetical protein
MPTASYAVFLRGANDDSAVAAAEIVNDVPLLDFGELEHLVDDFHRRGHEGDFFARTELSASRVEEDQKDKYWDHNSKS